MSINPNKTQQNLIILPKLAEKQKNQRAIKFKRRLFKQTHDIKLAEIISPIAMKLEDVRTSTQKVGEDLNENKSFQLEIENIPGIQSLRDASALMRRSKISFTLVENPNGEVFRNNVLTKP